MLKITLIHETQKKSAILYIPKDSVISYELAPLKGFIGTYMSFEIRMVGNNTCQWVIKEENIPAFERALLTEGLSEFNCNFITPCEYHEMLEEKENNTKNPLAQLKTLVEKGILSQEDYDNLEKMTKPF